MEINNVSSALTNYYNSNMVNSSTNFSNNTKIPPIATGDEDQKDKPKELKNENPINEPKLQSLFNNIQPNSGALANVKLSNDPKLFPQLNGGQNQVESKAMDVYNSIQNGTFKPSSTSITTSNPYSLYTNVNSMMNVLQSTGNLLNATA